MALAVAVVAYMTGFQDGHGRAEYERRPIERVVTEPYPFAAVCGDMLEAAWSIEDVIPPADAAALPHSP